MPQTDPQPFAGTLNTGEEPGQAILLSSAARTTAQHIVFSPGPDRGIVTVTVVLSAYSAGGLTPTIEIYDAASDSWQTLLSGVKLVGTTTGISYSVGPHALVTANVSQTCALGPYLRFSAAVDDATAITYSVGVRAS